jgi:hypothetical protein
MARQKCVECPFKIGSSYDEGWIEMVEKEATKPVGCHMITGGSNLNPAPGEECVGHYKSLEKLGRLAPLRQEAQCPTERSMTP